VKPIANYLKSIRHTISYAIPIESKLSSVPWPIGPVDPDPIMDQVRLFALGGYESVTLQEGNSFAAIVSGAVGQPIIARLYDMNGVLLGEGVTLGEESASAPAPDGLVPQSRLAVGGLRAGEHYLLQVAPAFDVGPTGVQEISVGFTQQGAGQ